MGDKTKISWTDASWNPATGCSKVSEGCKNCYAEKMAHRLKAMGQANYANGFKPACHEHMLDQPARWKRPRKIFVCSMGDLFHESIPWEFIYKVYEQMINNPHHIFQVLTKRPERMRHFVKYWFSGWLGADHIWHGVSVENSETVPRIDILKDVPCKNKFISFEPLMGCPDNLDLNGIDGAIIGGESGHGARPLEPYWMDIIIKDADRDGCKVFMKQFGAVWAKENKSATRKGDKMAEWPEWAQRREFDWAKP